MEEEKNGIEADHYKFLDTLYYIFKYFAILFVILIALAICKPDRVDFSKWALERGVLQYRLANFFVFNLLISENGDIAIGAFKTVYTINLHRELF